MACNYTADDWLDFPTSENCTWPWLSMTIDQWSSEVGRLQIRYQLGLLDQIVVLASCPIGLCSCICSILALWRKAIKERERFFIWMLIIAGLDLSFCISYVPAVLPWGVLFPSPFLYSYTWTNIAITMEGCVYAFSMGADLCTLALTIERFVIICRPTTQTGPSTSLTILGGLGITGLSIIRFIRYTFRTKVTVDPSYNETVYTTVDNYSITQSNWYITLVFISDIILPFILLISMLYFAARVGITIAKRRHSRVHENASTQLQQQLQKESSAMTKLLFVLVSLFVCNQLAYCLYAASIIVLGQSSVSFRSTLSDLRAHISCILFRTSAGSIGYIAECIARSTTFFFYYAFSGSIRREFRLFCRLS